MGRRRPTVPYFGKHQHREHRAKRGRVENYVIKRGARLIRQARSEREEDWELEDEIRQAEGGV